MREALLLALHDYAVEAQMHRQLPALIALVVTALVAFVALTAPPRGKAGPALQPQQVTPSAAAFLPVIHRPNDDMLTETAAALTEEAGEGPTATATATRFPTPTRARPSPTPTRIPTERPNCDPSYPTVCIPPPPPDLDCGDIPHRNFAVLQPDPHNFDGDRDGVGCEED